MPVQDFGLANFCPHRTKPLMDNAAPMHAIDRAGKINSQPYRKCQVQWLAEQLIERHAPRIVQHEYGAVPVTSSFDRSSRPSEMQLFSQRIFVLQSFQSFRRGIVHRWRKYQNLGVALLTCGAIKVKVLVPPQRLEDIF